MVEQEIKIRKVKNGYILEWDEEDSSFDGEDEKIVMVHQAKVIQEKHELNNFGNEDVDEKICMKELLEEIRDFFGFHYEKWDRNNITIEFKKGSKVLDEEAEFGTAEEEDKDGKKSS